MKAKKINILLKEYYLFAIGALFVTTIFLACVKKAEDIVTPPQQAADSLAAAQEALMRSSSAAPSSSGCAPNYGDSILCAVYSTPGTDKFIYPLNFPGFGKGTYVSSPQGLIMNPVTGAINITQSESGLAFKVGYVAKGSTDTCFTKVITAGINYLDGIHILSDNDTTVFPIYNGNMSGLPVCGNSGIFGDCAFDVPTCGPTLNSLDVRVNNKTGVINLKRTLLDGAFGRAPYNGQTTVNILYYRLADCSNKSLRKIGLKISYYKRYSDIPMSVINDITQSQKNIINAATGLAVFRGEGTSTTTTNPRPPHIVIVTGH